MTPPPHEKTYENNYDMSAYIDSEDEEAQAEAAVTRAGKQIPAWACGNELIRAVKAQCSMPQEQFTAWARSIFPPPVIPVPLNDMGLTVCEKYAVRSSSVNWKTANEIADAMLKSENGQQTN